jgi:CheY-like chemotaxis protein
MPLKAVTNDHQAADKTISPDRTKFRILLAEDNIVNLKVAQQQLRTLGYSVDAVANGQEAVRAFETIKYDLILMDCQMPIMDGYQATMTIRDKENLKQANGNGSTHTRIPIIAMTANAMVGDREKCIASGMDDYISKPVRKAELDTLLIRWLPMEYSKNNTPASTANGPMLDKEILNDLKDSVEGDRAQFAEFIDLYLSTTSERLEQLEKAIGEQDVQKIVSLSHALRGSSATIGASGIVDLFAEMENSARTGDISSSKSLLQKSQQRYTEIKVSLLAECDTM